MPAEKSAKRCSRHFGPGFVTELHQRKFDVFLRPEVSRYSKYSGQSGQASADLGVWMVNVHASVAAVV